MDTVLINHEAKDMEPMTDVVTVFLGLESSMPTALACLSSGRTTAGRAGQCSVWDICQKRFMDTLWHASRHQCDEHKPRWAVHLSTMSAVISKSLLTGW
jgi:hypothetical protein